MWVPTGSSRARRSDDRKAGPGQQQGRRTVATFPQRRLPNPRKDATSLLVGDDACQARLWPVTAAGRLTVGPALFLDN